MEQKNTFFDKLLASLKGFGRKCLITLKKNPQLIPLVMLVVSFLVYSLNLTSVSDSTATIQGKGMGLCEFATMLFSILSMIAMLNAFITISGNISPNSPPAKVPIAHPKYGNTPNPKKNDLDTFG